MFSILLLLLLLNSKNALNLPKTWQKVTIPFKSKARNWFISRAEKLGIKWHELTDYYKNEKVQSDLLYNYMNINDKSIKYPNYYTKPFHGYDEGNLNWLAAHEGEAATINIAAGYWPEVDPYVAQEWMRQNTTHFINDYVYSYKINKYDPSWYLGYHDPSNILDVGCSVGISTEYIKKKYPKSKVFGLDLSPYFLSVAKYRSNKQNLNITYVHANAEKTIFKDNLFSLVTCNYLFHEVPLKQTNIILHEIYRVLENNGVIAITDLEPNVLNMKENNFLSPFRRWMFEITEPHIYYYYENDMCNLLKNAGFINIVKCKNDPVNSVWLAQKKDIFL